MITVTCLQMTYVYYDNAKELHQIRMASEWLSPMATRQDDDRLERMIEEADE